MYAFGETWDSAHKIAIPYRKWLIMRYNKQKEAENKAQNGESPGSDTSKPMSKSERMKMISQHQQAGTTTVKDRASPGDFMTSQRNST